MVSGRLNGAETRPPRNALLGLRAAAEPPADIDYAADFAKTLFGTIGIKVWIYRGEVFEKNPSPLPKELRRTSLLTELYVAPEKVKHRKWHKLRTSGLRTATTKLTLSYGEFGLKALTPSWVTSRQIEAARRTMFRSIKRGGKIWIRIFPDKPTTVKGEVPMGGGKGAVDPYVAIVRAGTIVFEMDGRDRRWSHAKHSASPATRCRFRLAVL